MTIYLNFTTTENAKGEVMMKLKFCGFTSIKDVTAASQLPIDAIGFIHYEKVKGIKQLPK